MSFLSFNDGVGGPDRWVHISWLHPRNLTWNLKGSPQKRKFLLETIMFRFHVKFRGSMSGLIGKQHKTTPCLLGFRLGTLGVSSSESLRRDVRFFGFLNMGRGPFAEIDTTLAHGMQSFHWKICKGCLLHHYVGNKKWNFSSWWFQPIWNICSSNWIIPPIFGMNIKNI